MVLLADTTDTFRSVMCCFDVSSASKLQHLASSTRQKHKQSNLLEYFRVFLLIFSNSKVSNSLRFMAHTLCLYSLAHSPFAS